MAADKGLRVKELQLGKTGAGIKLRVLESKNSGKTRVKFGKNKGKVNSDQCSEFCSISAGRSHGHFFKESSGSKFQLGSSSRGPGGKRGSAFPGSSR